MSPVFITRDRRSTFFKISASTKYHGVFKQFCVEFTTFFLLFYFHLYIYPPDLQESDGGANTYGRQLPRPASGDAKILLSASNLIEI